MKISSLRENAGLDVVLAYHHGGSVEVLDVQAPLGVLVRGVRSHEVDVRKIIREALYHVRPVVYGQYFVPQRVEGFDHGDTETPQAYDELPAHRPPTWIAGRISGFGSASRSTSWVTGAVSPSPKRVKRLR